MSELPNWAKWLILPLRLTWSDAETIDCIAFTWRSDLWLNYDNYNLT